ncbi:MAG: hypothetical protein ACOC8X_00145 [Chloroflexota bacterium]
MARRPTALRALFRQRRWLPVALAVLAGAGYVALSALGDGPGFPLDDGWIHQTYARNLAQSGRWEYAPGVASNGSTSPLWTLLLSAGYLAGIPYLLWTFLLGVLCLAGLALAADSLWRALWPAGEGQAWSVATVLVLTWPLIWAAVSGMETALFLALAVLILALFLHNPERSAFWLGVLVGLLVLTRPEGVLLAGSLAVAYLLRQDWRSLVRYALGAGLLFVPYFAFNLWLGGELWPNTFYAKQAEYETLLEAPVALRFLQLLFFSLGGPAEGWRGMSGAHLLLAPGLLVAGWHALQQDWDRHRLYTTLPLLWALSHIAVYAWRLPVTYQHGRYLWAALPVWILYGLAGWQKIVAHRLLRGRSGRILRRATTPVFVIILGIFLLLGANAYATDVAFIENEMVDVALWLRENTAPQAAVAAHDIGAIGYFSERSLLDLAGLISPEIIPFLHDEAEMTNYVLQSRADYLVTAPGWPYELLTAEADVVLVYDTDYTWTREAGMNNMAVYRLPDAP